VINRRTWMLAGMLVVLLGGVVACAQTQSPVAPAPNKDGYTDITVEQLAEMMTHKDFVLVNVHIPYEGDLPQTDLSIPYNEIEGNLDKLPGQDARIVLYCRSGSMSTSAAEALASLGYSNVMELDGGMRAWKAAGYSLVGQ
jgi:rhodanese-related sulfurtransferase